MFGSQLEKSWQRFLIKKGDGLIENKCSYQDFYSAWQSWILNDRVEESSQREDKKLEGIDAKIQKLAIIAWKRKKGMIIDPEQKRYLNAYEAENGAVWWQDLQQYKLGK